MPLGWPRNVAGNPGPIPIVHNSRLAVVLDRRKRLSNCLEVEIFAFMRQLLLVGSKVGHALFDFLTVKRRRRVTPPSLVGSIA